MHVINCILYSIIIYVDKYIVSLARKSNAFIICDYFSYVHIKYIIIIRTKIYTILEFTNNVVHQLWYVDCTF